MGDIVDRIEDNLKNTPNKRIGDINIIYLAGVVEDMKKKLDNGVTLKIDKIWQKLNTLPCSVHAELLKKSEEISILKLQAVAKDMKDFEKDLTNIPKPNRVLINWLFGLYSIVVLGIALLALQVWN